MPVRTYVRLRYRLRKGFVMWRYEVFKDVGSNWRWRLRGGNGQIVTTSGESFASHRNALRAALNARANAGTATPPTDDYSQAVLRAALDRMARRKRARRLPPSVLR